MRTIAVILSSLLLTSVISGCTPEIGTPAWCEYMKQKPKGDWTTNEATDYARHCLFN